MSQSAGTGLMADARRALVLRVLSGPNGGAQIALGDGHWLIGGGPDADVTFADAALAPAHLRLAIGAGHIQATALEAGVRLLGVELTPGEAAVVVPGAALEIGETLFAVGPPGGPWPDRVRPPPAAAAEPDAAPAPPIVVPRPARLRRVYWAGPLGLLALGLAAAAVVSWLQAEAPPVVQAVQGDPLQSARAAIHALGLDGWVTAAANGARVTLTGQTRDEAQRRALVVAVQKGGGEADARVMTDATVVDLCRTVLYAFGVDAGVTLNAPGAAILTGYAPDSGQIESALQRLRADVPLLRRIEDRIDTPDRARVALQAAARERGLPLHIISTPRAVRVSGTLGGAAMADWSELAAGFRAAHDARIALEAQVTPITTAAPRGVVLGRRPALVMEDGRRLTVGDVLDTAGRIVAVDEKRVRVRSAAGEVDLPYSQKPVWVVEER